MCVKPLVQRSACVALLLLQVPVRPTHLLSSEEMVEPSRTYHEFAEITPSPTPVFVFEVEPSATTDMPSSQVRTCYNSLPFGSQQLPLYKHCDLCSGVIKESGLRRCDAASGEWDVSFWRNVMPSFWRIRIPWIYFSCSSRPLKVRTLLPFKNLRTTHLKDIHIPQECNYYFWLHYIPQHQVH